MNSPLNFGFMPGNMQNLQDLGINMFGGNMFGSRGAHQFIIDRIKKQRQGAGAAQNVAMNIATPDANSVGATGFSSMGGEMYADPSAIAATGAPTADLTGQGYATNRFGGFAGPTGGGTITAGMAMGNAPIATVGGFNPAASAAAEGMYGTEVDRATSVSPKKLITL